MAAETRKPIQFYFDFISPFGYFASLRIDELARRYGREVEWTSMLVGVSVLKVMGISPIVELPLKGQYVINDAKRYARQHQVAFERPTSSPTSRPVEAGRAFAWAKEVDPAAAKRLAGLEHELTLLLGADGASPANVDHGGDVGRIDREGLADQCLIDQDIDPVRRVVPRRAHRSLVVARAGIAKADLCGRRSVPPIEILQQVFRHETPGDQRISSPCHVQSTAGQPIELLHQCDGVIGNAVIAEWGHQLR